jgi:hypothetical protein
MENIKILFVSANPTGTTTLKLDEEVREIEAKIRAAATLPNSAFVAAKRASLSALK